MSRSNAAAAVAVSIAVCFAAAVVAIVLTAYLKAENIMQWLSAVQLCS